MKPSSYILLALLTSWASLPTSINCRQLRADDIVLADFEADDYGAWQVSGSAFGSGPASGTLPNQQAVDGFRGQRLVNSFFDGDASTGTLTSPSFKLNKRFLCFLMGGGKLPEQVGMRLLVNDQAVFTATGCNSETLLWQCWDVSNFAGKSAQVQIFDQATGGWGHINVDQIVLSDAPKPPFDTAELEAYRKSSEYLAEPLRPRFHFTPEIHWLNDPNGMFYHDGEYHLFYQYNPLGNQWGHMSWGHAVSPDMVHWEHLPLALPEEDGVMIFSGSAVVDEKNTSGFGDGQHTPIVAIYTAHQPGNQSQALAFSLDRGRTWTKYDGNPVIDISHAEFRDPKVFWHEPSKQWIMVVALAVDKRVQFYSSPDLKQWEMLSEFGPWGAKDVPNWECPDLFEVAVEGEPNRKRWLLLISVGNGSIAGGSGSQYFLGDFDGKNFTPDTPADVVNWVDYGRDFYAAHRWVHLPGNDPAPTWIAWMNNWETCLLPTERWRGAMSIPRKLSLRNTGDQLRLVQRPIDQLEQLRVPVQGPKKIEVKSGQSFRWATDSIGVAYELQCKIKATRDAKFGFRLRASDSAFTEDATEAEQTLLAYDIAERRLTLDRTYSGRVDFHSAFPGQHTAPLIASEDGEINLRILVDTTSVEVFSEDGMVVLTDRIFPNPESTELGIYCEAGEITFESLSIFNLQTVETLAKP